ncbi:Ribosomal RNA small subunit methyltransferase H [Oligella urethralis]|uniref:16S rRNA (cytosine(1402)-N(4))-methyltransferase RsmH n=1 Tax=Oligella urethralis TaxID=90245 RepID=UPI002958B9D9|nr:16S rRNA (cytosine(1402)-N(4))-methyltransferase RsmH [Oligella urethralis]WOS36962.1 Ribosomal RNA small subunit methyltransferase H [Oligella urethralis]
MSQDFSHTTVLLHATVNALVDPHFNAKSKAVHSPLPAQQKDGVFVDGTFGRGGHSRYLLSHLSPKAKLFVFDKDPAAIEVAAALRAEDPRVIVVHDAFSSMAEVLAAHGIGKVQGIMMDLGVSSPQLDDAARGFSFMRDGPLDMRMDTSRGITAAEWLNTASFDEIRGVIKDYGEERYAFQIAKKIVDRRQSGPFRSTLELAQLVAGVVKSREKGHHPATRTFQAIRIHINQEHEELSRSLASVLDLLDVGGRLAVISFHSLEDRPVKQAIAQASTLDPALAKLPLRETELPAARLINLGKVQASAEEIKHNPRSRSAMLRVAERTAAE